MPTYTVNRSADAPAIFVVVGPDGCIAPDANDFLTHLATHGRSAYTLRSYARGLAHFLGWLAGAEQPIDTVTRQTIDAYIVAFRHEEKSGACRVAAGRVGQINMRTRKAAPTAQRQPRTINHQLSVLASFFAYRIQSDTDRGTGAWVERPNPVPTAAFALTGTHSMPGRDVPRRGRASELRQRVPRRLPRQVEPTLAEQLIDTATSWRDKAILTLLYRTGQRIGDWSPFAGRHGVLGMTLADIDERTRTVTVLLKGARDEHRVPVTDDFWPLFQRYLTHEHAADPSVSAAWVGLRKGRGKPLSYATFESSLRYIGRKLGANVHAHMFRHSLAQAIIDMGQLTVAQEILGHRHLSTTVDVYAHVDQRAMVEALVAAKDLFAARRQEVEGPSRARETSARAPGLPESTSYVFAYDDVTLRALDEAAVQRPGPGGGGDRP